jgi:hypothetical protein
MLKMTVNADIKPPEKLHLLRFKSSHPLEKHLGLPNIATYRVLFISLS